jgi:hypothetical protein
MKHEELNRQQRRKSCAALRHAGIVLESHDRVLDRILPTLPGLLSRAVADGADPEDLGILALHEGDPTALEFWQALIDPQGTPPAGRVAVVVVPRSRLGKVFEGLDARPAVADDAPVEVPVVIVTRRTPRAIVVPFPRPGAKVVEE